MSTFLRRLLVNGGKQAGLRAAAMGARGLSTVPENLQQAAQVVAMQREQQQAANPIAEQLHNAKLDASKEQLAAQQRAHAQQLKILGWSTDHRHTARLKKQMESFAKEQSRYH